MKAAVYCRVSTEVQSHDSQLLQCRDWCRRNGIEAIEYSDTITGASKSRPGLDRLMADIREGRVGLLLCYKLDRLGRSLVHVVQMISEIRSYGCAVVCISQGIDTRDTSPGALFQLHVMAAFGELERNIIKERTRAGLEATKARGTVLGRKPGHGKKMRNCIPRAKTMKTDNGWSNRRISRELNISEASVRRILAA